MRWILSLLYAALPAVAAIPVASEVSLTNSYRTEGKWETNRGLVSLGMEPSWGPIQTRAQIWGWYNASYTSYSMRRYDLSVRALNAALWRDQFGLTVGVQQIHWGETFGFQAADLVSARNYRDFPLLDHAHNRLPVPAVHAFGSVGPLKVEGVFNPRSEYPILPARVRGVPVAAVPTASWFQSPEWGGRVSAFFSESSASAFVYRHQNRFPVLNFVLPGEWVPGFQPVTSIGGSFSSGFEQWVLRADAVVTPNHPVTGSPPQTVYSTTWGADWTGPESGWSLGGQFHWDQFPIAQGHNTGASALVRKQLWRNRLDCEAQVYHSFRYLDTWLRLQTRLGLGQGWEITLLGEVFDLSQDSPFTFFAQSSRVASTVSYVF